MKPDVAPYLDELVRSLAQEVAPALPTSWEQSAVLRHSLLLQAVRHEFDGAAAWRAEENQALRVLFADARPVVADTGLRARLDDAAASAQTSLRVSELDAANRLLRAVLVALHEHLESLDTPAAQALLRRVWQELRDSTVRRRGVLDRF